MLSAVFPLDVCGHLEDRGVSLFLGSLFFLFLCLTYVLSMCADSGTRDVLCMERTCGGGGLRNLPQMFKAMGEHGGRVAYKHSKAAGTWSAAFLVSNSLPPAAGITHSVFSSSLPCFLATCSNPQYLEESAAHPPHTHGSIGTWNSL